MPRMLPSSLAVAAALTLVGVGCWASGQGNGFMSDDAMIANLRAQRASFDSLATMLDTDRKIRAFMANAQYADTGGTYQVRHAPHAALGGIPGERWDAYARLLTRTGAGRNVDNGVGGILFTQWVEGAFVQKRQIHGYYYARRPPHVGAATTITYRPIEGSWYLYSLRR